MMMAPECRPWSLMQNLNYRTPERRALLQDMRNLEEETHLKFYEKVHADSKKIYFDCTLQPADAAAWLMPTLENMKGYYETVLDRCGIGLKASPDDPRMVRKPTKFRSTSKKVCVAVNLRCQCDIGHTQMMGRGAVLKAMQNYEPDLVRRLGDAIYESMAEVWKRRGQAELMTLELVEHSNEEMQYLEQNKELVKIGGPEVLKPVALLHRQLGNPNGSKLVLAAKTTCLTSMCGWPDATSPQCIAKAHRNQCEWRRFTRRPTSTTLWPLTRSTSDRTRRNVLSSPSWANSVATRSTAKSRMRPLRWKLDCLSPHGPRTSATRRF